MGFENPSEHPILKRTARINGVLIDVDFLLSAEGDFPERTVSSADLSFLRTHDRGWSTSAGEEIGPKQLIDLAEECGTDFDAMMERKPFWAEHIGRVREANILKPILVTENFDLIDGAHRVAKMFIENREEIPARIISMDQLEKYKRGQI